MQHIPGRKTHYIDQYVDSTQMRDIFPRKDRQRNKMTIKYRASALLPSRSLFQSTFRGGKIPHLPGTRGATFRPLKNFITLSWSTRREVGGGKGKAETSSERLRGRKSRHLRGGSARKSLPAELRDATKLVTLLSRYALKRHRNSRDFRGPRTFQQWRLLWTTRIGPRKLTLYFPGHESNHKKFESRNENLLVSYSVLD